MKYWPMIALVLLTGCHKNQPLSPLASTPNPATPKTFVLMGQSNMNGYVADPYPKDPNVTEINFRYPEHGPGYIFAENFTAQGTPVVLVQCAVNGSPIKTWVPGGMNYVACMDQLTAAHIAHLDGVLYYQGEGDVSLPNEPWAEEFTVLVRDLQKRFPKTPIVYAQIGFPFNYGTPDAENAGIDWIRDQQTQISIPGVSMITTGDIPVVDQSWHHGYDGNVTIGNRFYAAFKQL